MCLICAFFLFFFFKQKTAYEMRISDWSSDVCSSDLLDRVVADDRTGRIEAHEGEGVDEFVERDSVLQADRDRHGEAVHERPEGGALLAHVDEDLAELAVLVLAGAQVDIVAAEDRKSTRLNSSH